MSTLETILARAMSDAVFADQLFADPEKAVAGYDLSADELASLKTMTRPDFDKFAAASPEERKSFSMIPGRLKWENINLKKGITGQ